MSFQVLNRNEHRNLKLRQGASGYRHAEGFHVATLVAAELAKAAREYPVLFARLGDIVQPLALLSLVPNENQYLTGEQWQANYVPAAVRLYPFKLAGECVVVDTEAPLLSESEGEPLFTDDGEPTTVLGNALDSMRTYHAAQAETRRICERLMGLGLLAERQAEVVSPQGIRYRLNGFLAVDEEQLKALADAELLELARNGVLRLIHAHLISLENLAVLACRRDSCGSVQDAAQPAVSG